MSGYGKKVTKQGALTSWRSQREGPIRTQDESDQTRDTYNLEMAEGGTLSGHRKTATKQGVLTNWRPHRERLVRTQKECNQAGGTHNLETAEEHQEKPPVLARGNY